MIDLLIAMMLVSILVAILRHLDLGGKAVELVLFVSAWLYPILVYRGLIAGMGRWSLGLHRFKYSEIDEYQGVGTLVVYEPLEAKVYSKRALLTLLPFVLFYVAVVFIENGP